MSRFYVCSILMFCLIASNQAYAKKDTNKQTCDVEFANFFQTILDARADNDIRSLGKNHVDGMRVSAEEMMLSLSSFDPEGCSGKTRKHIQTLYNHAARMQKSYQKYIEMDAELHNTPPEELRAEMAKALKQREKANKRYEEFLKYESSVYDYVLPKVDKENLQ